MLPDEGAEMPIDEGAEMPPDEDAEMPPDERAEQLIGALKCQEIPKTSVDTH